MRTRCSVCGADGLEPILTLSRFPVFQGCVSDPPTEDELAPMPWAGCAACRSAQIAYLPPLAQIYRDKASGALGEISPRGRTAFAAFLSQVAKGAILEIGTESSALALTYKRQGGRADWTILELDPLLAPASRADVARVESHLKRAALTRAGAQSIVLCHVLEHVADLRSALADISASLPEDGRLLVAWPVFERQVKKGLACALNFARPAYVPLPALKALFARTGFRLCADEFRAESDAVFLAFERGTGAEAPLTDIPPAPGPVIADYFARFRAEALKAMRAMARHRGEVFLMPAGIEAQALIAAGLTETRLSGALDSVASEQGKRLCGTSLSVFAPAKRLAQARSPLVIVNGGAHTAEMIEALRRIRADVAVYDVSAQDDEACAPPFAVVARG